MRAEKAEKKIKQLEKRVERKQAASDELLNKLKDREQQVLEYEYLISKLMEFLILCKEHVIQLRNELPETDGAKGYGLHVGAVPPMLGGDFTAGLYYVDGELEQNSAASNDVDIKYYGAALRYGYPLSKRTTLYTGAG